MLIWVQLCFNPSLSSGFLGDSGNRGSHCRWWRKYYHAVLLGLAWGWMWLILLPDTACFFHPFHGFFGIQSNTLLTFPLSPYAHIHPFLFLCLLCGLPRSIGQTTHVCIILKNVQ